MPGVTQPPDASGGWGPPGRGQPGGWGEPVWGPPGWPGWAPPPVKPGVVALRPLGVGDVLDGAIAAVRRNPRALLGLSAVVLAVSTTVQQVVTWLVTGRLVDQLGSPGVTPQDVLRALARAAPAYLLPGALGWVATTLLAGVLAFCVGRAVIGEYPRPRQAWGAVRPVAGRLLGLTLVVGVLVALPLVAVSVVVLLCVFAAVSGDLTLVVGLLAAVAIPAALALAAWLWVRWCLAGPALVLESAGGARHLGVSGALARSVLLVRGAWWRTFGLLLLVVVLSTVVARVVATPFGFSAAVVGGPASDSLAALVLQSAGTLIGALLTVPFQAAAITLLYVDRRIRDEGLDVELARAAGVTLPGRPTP